MDLFCDKSFSYPNGMWIESDSEGTGTKTVVNRLVTFNGTAPQLYANYLIRPGETLRFSVMAKCSASGGVIAIDVENKAEGAYDHIKLPVKSTFERYEICRTCPLTKTEGEIVIVIIGNAAAYSNSSTSTKFYDPKVEIIGNVVAAPSLRTLAFGLIQLNSAKRGIHESFISGGVYSVSVSSTNITVTLNHIYSTPGDALTPKRPLIFCSATPDNGAMIATAGSIAAGIGSRATFIISLYDAAGAVINPSTVPNAYISFEVKWL